MPILQVKHEGGVSSSINVRGHKVIVDVPKPMGGEDRGPTPVDLLAGSLGSCIVYYIARWCQTEALPHEGFSVEVEYVLDMQAHCVPVLSVKIKMPDDFPAARQAELMKVAEGCTVHNTLCSIPQIQMTQH
jgi:putative redox protein